MTLIDDRAEYVSQDALNEAADTFVRAMGWRNADRLSENLRHTIRASDALKALDNALVRNFNIVRQEQIRAENTKKRRTSCGRDICPPHNDCRICN